MASLATRGFFNLHNVNSDSLGEGKAGGRLDLKKQINDIDFQLSVTDASVKDYEAAPWVKDLLLTGDKRVNDNLAVGVGYDTGNKGVFASVTASGDISDRPVLGTATWLQRGNIVRTEGTVKFDGDRSKLWAGYTFNAEGHDIVPRTVVNLEERKAFIIEPFAVNIATKAAKYTYERDGYTFEPAYDFNREAAFLTVSRRYDNTRVKAGYAVKDEVALVEVQHRPTNTDLPDIRFYVKAPVRNAPGDEGSAFGRLTAGVIFDRSFDL